MAAAVAAAVATFMAAAAASRFATSIAATVGIRISRRFPGMPLFQACTELTQLEQAAGVISIDATVVGDAAAHCNVGGSSQSRKADETADERKTASLKGRRHGSKDGTIRVMKSVNVEAAATWNLSTLSKDWPERKRRPRAA